MVLDRVKKRAVLTVVLFCVCFFEMAGFQRVYFASGWLRAKKHFVGKSWRSHGFYVI